MSRTGRKIIEIPEKVKVNLQAGKILVEGPLGKLAQDLPDVLEIQIDAGKTLVVNRKSDSPDIRSLHGLIRALIANMVTGVSTGFKRELDIQGVGYRAEVKGSHLNLSLGFSHPVEFPIPSGIKIAVEKLTHLIISGFDKKQVGQVAADIRKIRPPEPYKGKGVRYSDEVIRRKAGKAASSGK